MGRHRALFGRCGGRGGGIFGEGLGSPREMLAELFGRSQQPSVLSGHGMASGTAVGRWLGHFRPLVAQ